MLEICPHATARQRPVLVHVEADELLGVRGLRPRAFDLALGVSCDGDREVFGLWWQETEGAKFWLSVLNDLQRRGVRDVLVACVDGLRGFPDAIEAVFPQAWAQTCEREAPVSRWYGVRYWTVRSILRPSRPPER